MAVAAALGALLMLVVGVTSGKAEKVGVAAAVNPDAFSSLSGAPNRQLSIGKSIFYNERIETTSSGLVQVLLVDGSTFTVGPGSDLVIDRFVYNPKKKSGEVVATFSKGAMRFVGGKLSKNDNGVTVKTPLGSLSIRGGIVQAAFGPSTSIISFIYGDYARLTLPSGRDLTAFEPGYTIEPGVGVRPTTDRDLALVMRALTNSNVATNSAQTTVRSSEPTSASQLADVSSIDEMISDANVVQITSEILNQLREEEPVQVATDNVASSPPPDNAPSSPPPPDNTPEPPPPPPNPGGYAAGILQSDVPQQNFENIVVSRSPQEFLLGSETTPTTMVLYDVSEQDAASRYEFGFGADPEAPLQAAVFDRAGAPYADVGATGYLIDGRAAELTRQFPETFGEVPPQASAPDICSQCEFVGWGGFATEVAFSNGPATTNYVDRISGWWVSGNLSSPVEIDALAALGATANYNGHVIGSVLSAGEAYNAAGDLWMGWNFAQRSGELTISNFDNRSFGTGPGGLTQPNPSVNQFGGTLNQLGGTASNSVISGNATGSFVRGPGDPTRGVIGNWHASGGGYRATGIFAGSKTAPQ